MQHPATTLKGMACRFRAARERAGLTLEEVAEAADVTPVTVRHWEGGTIDPIVSTWLLAVVAINASPDQIARGDPFLALMPEEIRVDRLAHRLRAVREQRGIGQRELARRVGLTHATVMRWEGGQRRPRLLALLLVLEALDSTLNDLVICSSEPTVRVQHQRSS